jgi:hypothetical protein
MRVILSVAAALAIGYFLAGRAGAGPAVHAPQVAAQARTAAGEAPVRTRPPFARRAVGPGVIVTSKFGGPIFGWAIDENGSDGLLSEVTPPSGNPYTSIVETFDQTTGKITKVVAKEGSGPSGSRELVVDAILANDVGLIDDELRKNLEVHDKYYVMAPVTGNKVNGMWTRPPGKDFLLWAVADQQTDPTSVMATTILQHGISQPPTFQVVVTNVATNQLLYVLSTPKGDGVNYPYLVAEDTATHHAYVPAANYRSETVFIDYDVSTGRVSNNFVAPAFSGPVFGIAIDSATHMMCTTTHSTYSVQMYDLKTKKRTFVGQIPNAGGEGQAGSSIAADPVHHLFLVEQPNSLLGGSEVYVYDEKGNVLEGLTGFRFSDSSGILVNASARSGFVAGPAFNQVQSFTY